LNAKYNNPEPNCYFMLAPFGRSGCARFLPYLVLSVKLFCKVLVYSISGGFLLQVIWAKTSQKNGRLVQVTTWL